MKNPLCLFIVIVIAFTACDQGSEMLEPVIKDIMEDETSVVTDDTPVVPDAPSVYSQYDVNQDGNVDNTDLALVSAAIGEKQPSNARLDVDGNGSVDGTDIILVSNNFGESATDTPQDTRIIDQAEPTAKSDISEITFDNALNLMPGEKYRFKPTSFSTIRDEIGEFVIGYVHWGSVSIFGKLIERDHIPLDTPKISIEFRLDPTPYRDSLDGVHVFDHHPLTWEVFDEIVVEVVSKGNQEERKGGERGNIYTYTFIQYKGTLIENLTRPDSLFEYE